MMLRCGIFEDILGIVEQAPVRVEDFHGDAYLGR